MENRSRTLSLLDEIKDIATKEAATEKIKPAEPAAPTAASQPARRATTSLNLELSKALADIHETVSRDAEREEQRRQQTLDLERAAKEARERARDVEQAQELDVRLRAEAARQQAADEERRLKVLRLEYEAALARGEQVELPEELRPKPVPQVVAQLQAAALAPVVVAPPKRDPRIVWGGIAAFVAIAAGVAFFITARMEEERLERERIEAERVAELRRVQAERAAAEAKLQEELRIAREVAEAAKKAQLEAALAAQRAEEDRKRAEEESKKKAKRPGTRKEEKKPVINGINFTGF